MYDFPKIFRNARTQTAVVLKAALAEIDIGSFTTAHNAAVSERRSLVLTGSDADIAAAERRLAAAQLALDRAIEAKDELVRRITIAEREEAAASLTAERTRVDASAEALAARLSDRWPKLTREVAGLLAQLKDSNEAVREINRKLADAGRESEAVAEAEWRWRRRPTVQLEAVVSILTTTRLPTIEENTSDA